MSKFTGKATSSGENGEKREVPPAGSHPAVLVGIIDLGTQTVEYGGESKQAKKVLLVWELTAEPLSGTKDRNHVLGRDYTLSYHEKSSLRLLYERWRGRKYKEDEEIDYGAALGKPCLVSVTIGESAKGSAFGKIDGVSPVPKGLPVPPPKHTPFTWTMEDGTPIPEGGWLPFIFGKSITETVQASAEWKSAHGTPATTASGKPRNGQQQPASDTNGDGDHNPEGFVEPAGNNTIPW